MNLTDADKILFDQQVQSMVEDGEVQDAARGNDFDQFSVFARKRLTLNLLKRHSANEDLVKAFLDVPEFKEMVEAAVLAEVYEKAGVDPFSLIEWPARHDRLGARTGGHCGEVFGDTISGDAVAG